MAHQNNSYRFIQSDNVVACDLDGGKALLDLNASQYYQLNEIASLIWESIETPKSIEELVGIVVKEFDVSESLCRKDIEALLGSFEKSILVKRRDESSSH